MLVIRARRDAAEGGHGKDSLRDNRQGEAAPGQQLTHQ
jgi:hypothetical protein